MRATAYGACGLTQRINEQDGARGGGGGVAASEYTRGVRESVSVPARE